MPQVPRLESQRFTTAPLRGGFIQARTTPSTFGLASARGIQALGRASFEIYQDEKRKADEIAVLDANRELVEFETDLLYNPETGLLNKRGRDAFQASEATLQQFTDKIGEIETRLGNDEQKLAFRRSSSSRQVNMDRTVQRHVAKERTEFDKTVTDNFIANERASAVANYNDDDRVQQSIDNQINALLEHKDRNGLPLEWLQRRITEATSQTHVAVIERMLANEEDLSASRYFKDNKDEITGADIAKVERSLAEGSLRGESQRRSDTILAQTSNRLDALAKARTIRDPKVRDATEERINRFFSVQKQAEAERRQELFLQASRILEQNGGDLEGISPSMWTGMDDAQRKALRATVRTVRDGIEPTQNDKRWLEFLDLSTTDLANMSQAELLTKFRPHLDDAHWNRANTLWADARSGKVTAKLSSTLTFKDRVDNSLRRSGIIDPNKTKAKFTDEEATNYAQFEDVAAKAIEVFELTELGGKRKATGTEQQKIIDELLIEKVFVEEWGRDPEKPIVLLTDDERAASYVPTDNIPIADRNFIENLIRSRGRRVTTDKVQRAYAQYLLGDLDNFHAIIGE